MSISERSLLVVAFVQRSGSNYFCDRIIEAGGFGIPYEYYYPNDFSSRLLYWSTQIPLDIRIDPVKVSDEQKWFTYVCNKGAVKCDFAAYTQMLNEARPRSEEVAKDFVYLTRRDKLRQAISWYRADITGRFISSQVPIRKDPEYVRKEIQQRLLWIADSERSWEYYLQGKRVLRLVYEDLDIVDCLDKLEEFTGRKRIITVPYESDYHQILRDEITDDWVRRYELGV